MIKRCLKFFLFLDGIGCYRMVLDGIQWYSIVFKSIGWSWMALDLDGTTYYLVPTTYNLLPTE